MVDFSLADLVHTQIDSTFRYYSNNKYIIIPAVPTHLLTEVPVVLTQSDSTFSVLSRAIDSTDLSSVHSRILSLLPVQDTVTHHSYSNY